MKTKEAIVIATFEVDPQCFRFEAKVRRPQPLDSTTTDKAPGHIIRVAMKVAHAPTIIVVPIETPTAVAAI